MYATRLKVCVDIDNLSLKQKILNAIEAFKTDTMQITIVKDKESVSRNCYLLYVCDSRVKAHNIVYSMDTSVYIIWCGSWSDFDFSINNVISFIRQDMPDIVITNIVHNSLKYTNLDAHAYLYKYLLQNIIDLTPDLVWFKDESGKYTFVNEAFIKASGKPASDCIDKVYTDVWDHQDNDDANELCKETEDIIIKEHCSMQFDETVTVEDGRRHYLTYKAPLYDAIGNVLGTCGIGHDYTNFKNINIELEIILSSIPFPVFICDKDYNVVKMNSSAENITSYDMLNGFNYKVWKEAVFSLVKDDNSYTIYETKVSPVVKQYEILEQKIFDHQNDLRGYFCIFRDVTYTRMYEQVIKEVAMTDALTGLYNRRYFYTTMNNLAGGPITLLYIDIDRFKEVNDTFGHSKGDQVLCTVATHLKEVYSKYKVFRLGGDEFAVIIPEQVLANVIIEKHSVLHEALLKEFANDGVSCDVSLGINCTEYLHDIDDFINKADERMYTMKKEHHGIEQYTEDSIA